MYAPEASEIGRLMMGTADETKQLSYVIGALGGKSFSTLKKRLSQVTKFLTWACAADPPRRVFPIRGTDVCDYIDFLRARSKGHSVLCGVVEMVNFLKFVLGVDVESSAVNSAWLRGVLRRSLQERPKRRQSRPLTVAELKHLESFLHDPKRSVSDRYAAGCFLFIAYSRARVCDVAHVGHFIADINTDASVDRGYLEISSKSHKMRAVGNALGMDLLLVAPICGVSNSIWGRDFLEVCNLAGLTFAVEDNFRPLLPVPEPGGGWSDKPVTSSEAGRWLKHIQIGHG